MKNKEGEFVYLDDDGAEWVRYEYFQKINTIALESKLIIERIQMLLGVYTTTEALARIVELQASNAAQQSVQADGAYCACENSSFFVSNLGLTCWSCKKPRR